MPDSPDTHDRRMTRRAFSRHAATAAAGILLGSALPAQETTMPAVNPPAVPPAPNTDALLASILERCPALGPDDHKELADQIKSVLDLQKSLHKLPVPDGAEPDFVFRAAREAHNAR